MRFYEKGRQLETKRNDLLGTIEDVAKTGDPQAIRAWEMQLRDLSEQINRRDKWLIAIFSSLLSAFVSALVSSFVSWLIAFVFPNLAQWTGMGQ
ncbi:hypothetical protein [Flexibacterium corallicola]|uniref:hypothetical protein n=1 Tax=Flexibacterium corallicola TaxID=3037259 RepID=UPI00286EEC38|nr:hypothetical protein [Pseudovibrio sp. M1P-2-3]